MFELREVKFILWLDSSNFWRSSVFINLMLYTDIVKYISF